MLYEVITVLATAKDKQGGKQHKHNNAKTFHPVPPVCGQTGYLPQRRIVATFRGIIIKLIAIVVAEKWKIVKTGCYGMLKYINLTQYTMNSC